MADRISLRDETRLLADAMFDRRINAENIQRLNELLTSDLGCLQAYVEQIDLHGELMEQAAEHRPMNIAVSVMDQIARTTARRERRLNWLMTGGTLAFLIAVTGVFGLVLRSGIFTAITIGTIASLSSEIQNASSLELGQVLYQGRNVSVPPGVATFQLPGVTLDVTGPARIRLKDARNLELESGRIHAIVGKSGQGFTVQTRDSKVVDLGTEFIVSHFVDRGTEVSVRRGRVQASLLNWNHVPEKVLNLTTERRAFFSMTDNQATEIDYLPQEFETMDRLRGTIRSLEGMLRTSTTLPETLTSKTYPTPNFMLVLPEQQQVAISEEMRLNSVNGPVRIPQGSVISSYLVHYDPDMFMNKAPRGAITFEGEIAAVLVNNSALQQTDAQFGLKAIHYEPSSIRELELDEDEVRISDDRMTVSFYFGVSGVEPLDQARILVWSHADPKP